MWSQPKDRSVDQKDMCCFLTKGSAKEREREKKIWFFQLNPLPFKFHRTLCNFCEKYRSHGFNGFCLSRTHMKPNQNPSLSFSSLYKEKCLTRFCWTSSIQSRHFMIISIFPYVIFSSLYTPIWRQPKKKKKRNMEEAMKWNVQKYINPLERCLSWSSWLLGFGVESLKKKWFEDSYFSHKPLHIFRRIISQN